VPGDLDQASCRARAGPHPAAGGPRQVGKTTLILEIADRLGRQAVYAAADAPEAALPGFLERLLARAEDVAAAERRAIVLLDEAHLLHD